jgi:hypothetical protein
MVDVIILIIFGLLLMIIPEIKITRNRRVKGWPARLLALVSVAGANLTLFYGNPYCTGTSLVVILLGLAMSEKIDKSPEVL